MNGIKLKRMKLLKIKNNRKSKVISEVTVREIAQISDVLADLDPNKLAFNDLFKGKMRLILQVSSAKEQNINIKFLFDLFERNGYNVDFFGGKIEKDIETQRGTQKRTLKIGKVLTRAAYLIEALHSDDPELRGRDPTAGLAKLLPKLTIGETGKVTKLQDFWVNESERYRKVSQEVEQDFVIVSRHPIDVARMADFEGIESCHSPPSRSPGSGYYNCALADAKGNAAIAYLIDVDWLKEFFGDSKDIVELQEKLLQYEKT